MGLTNRREFLLGGTVSPILQRTSGSLQVEVMEVFLPSNGPAALLVHHADEATRAAFGEWLRASSGKSIICALPNGKKVDARIFRVSLCFGRGLILMREPVPARAKDVLTIT